MADDSLCKHPENHHHHLCVLRTHLSKSALSDYTREPRYICANCSGRVHEGKNLCNPIKLKK